MLYIIPALGDITTAERSITWPASPGTEPWLTKTVCLNFMRRATALKPGGQIGGTLFCGSAPVISGNWAVVLNAPQMWEDTMRLLNYGLIRTAGKVLCRDRSCCASVTKVKEGKCGWYAAVHVCSTLNAGEDKRYIFVFFFEEEIYSALVCRDKLGRVQFSGRAAVGNRWNFRRAFPCQTFSPGAPFLACYLYVRMIKGPSSYLWSE